MTMRRHPLALLALLGGCNQILDLRQTAQLDARFFDGPPAPTRCPTLGTPPVFSTALHQHLYEDAEGFAPTRNGRAFALCYEFSYTDSSPICDGPIDGPLTPSVGIPRLKNFEGRMTLPRPSPDGERLFVRHVDSGENPNHWYYARNGDGSWRRLADPPFFYAYDVSTLAMGPTGYLAIVGSFDGTIQEWVDEGGQWRQLRVHPGFGTGFGAVAMTWDGLRGLVLTSSRAPMYIERQDLESTFGAAQPIEGLPVTGDAYMVEDCSRMYLTGLGYVFYAEQR